MARLYDFFIYGIINNIFSCFAVNFVSVFAYGERIAQLNAYIYKDKRKFKAKRRATVVPA